MMRLSTFLVIVSLCLCVVSCDRNSVDARSQDTVSLKFGESKYVYGPNLTVHFIDVPHETRCPVGARCIHPGCITIRLELIQLDDTSKLVDFGCLSPGETEINGWIIHWEKILPIQPDGFDHGFEDYECQLRFEPL